MKTNIYPAGKKYRGAGIGNLGGNLGITGALYGKWFVTTGQFRPPKKGEFYLSGSIPQVYDARNDLTSAYNIMVPCNPPPKTIVKDGFTYTLTTADHLL